MTSQARHMLLGGFCIAAGLVALGVGGLALYIAGGVTLAFGLLVAGFA